MKSSPLRRFEIKLMALSAIIFRFGMLMVAKIAVQFRPIMRRCVRIGRFYIFRFFSQLCRGAMTDDTLFHGQGFGLFCFPVAFYAINIRQHVMMAVGQLSRQAEIILIMAGLAGFPVHRLGVRMFFRQHLLLHVTG